MNMISHDTEVLDLKRILLFASFDSLLEKIRKLAVEDDFIPIDRVNHVVGRVRLKLPASVIRDFCLHTDGMVLMGFLIVF